MGQEQVTVCPRCQDWAYRERFYGPCKDCRKQLIANAIKAWQDRRAREQQALQENAES